VQYLGETLSNNTFGYSWQQHLTVRGNSKVRKFLKQKFLQSGKNAEVLENLGIYLKKIKIKKKSCQTMLLVNV